ncbi:MAG TPA: D-alanyl-D-alanine carboxypeptidase/D-alanyl-D-alanine-endopeptidase [Thermoanaerobaculia bacterium]|nr:D-alanyl-D-alanine carboxypeptidase/D-alanyl-D-alanine-endopeptidase [Thermoanaerobaculia bacterium]
MRLRNLRLVSAVVLLAAACATAPAPDPRIRLSRLIDEQVALSPFDHALWGIHVEEEDGTVVYSRNGALLMIPASNRKLFTTALVESCFALDSTIPTELLIEGEVGGGVLVGNVIVKGWGDPSFAGRYDEGVREVRLAPFPEGLRARGIERVLGSVLGDGSAFDRDVLHGTWQFEDLGTPWQTPVDALAFNENVVGVFFRMPECGRPEITTDPPFVRAVADIDCGERKRLILASDATNTVSVTGTLEGPAERTEIELVSIRDASLYAAQGIHDLLTGNGIAIENPPRAGTASRSTERVALIESPPLAELLATVMKPSQNLYADAMLKRVGGGGPEPASFERALEIERLFLTGEVGIDPTEFSFADGSGLSVRNLVTPRAIVKLLRWMDAPPRRGANAVIFAIPGEQEGTLRRRLPGLERTMRGKTGTLTGVNALSGILTGSGGNVRYFSVVVNHHAAGSSRATAIIDAIVHEIARF